MTHYLSLCAILRGEELYLAEFLNYYIKQGVEQFYLYDNSDNKEQLKVVQPYIDHGLVTWYKLPGLKQQRVAYNHCINTYKKETEWCAFFDCDEFLWSTKDIYFVTTLKNIYDRDDINGLAVHWMLFGSSGHLSYSPEPVTRRFTKRAAHVNPHVKSIMRMKHTECMSNDPHTFEVSTGIIVDESFSVMPRHYATEPGTANVMRLNHYFTKSYQELMIRKTTKPDANSGVYKDAQMMFDSHDCNDATDEGILARV